MEAPGAEIPQPKENPYEAFGDWIRENPGERLGKAMALSDYGAELAVKLILDDKEVKANDLHQYDEAETRLAVIEEGARAHGVLLFGYDEACRIEEEDIEHTPDKISELTSWAITQSLQRTAKRYAHPRLSSPKPPSSPPPQG